MAEVRVCDRKSHLIKRKFLQLNSSGYPSALLFVYLISLLPLAGAPEGDKGAEGG